MAAARKKAPAKLVLSRTDEPPAPKSGKPKGKTSKGARGGESATDVLRRVYLTALGVVSAVAFLSILVHELGHGFALKARKEKKKRKPRRGLVKPQKCRHVKTPGLCGVLTPVFYRRQLV